MRLNHVLWGGLIVIALGLAGFAVWIMTLPSPATATAPPIPEEEAVATLEALKPPRRERPLIAVIGINDATETTDYIMPLGILRRADVADVVALATGPGPLTLYPALTVEPDATIAEFDAANPDGADYVIVPAMDPDDDPAALAWIRSQAGKGAVIVSVCAGAKVIAAAGLLDGRRGTTHWYYLDELRRLSPTMRYVADRRLVVDDGVATTTGISASMPMMLTLIEAIAVRDKAEAVALDLGVASWDARHPSAAFRLTRPFATTVLGNVLAFWNRDALGVALEPGIDEVSLALVADAWSRTYRSKAVTFAEMPSVLTANGLRVLPDQDTKQWPRERVVTVFPDHPPMAALDRTLQAITERYGDGTTNVVAMQIEYPRPDTVR